MSKRIPITATIRDILPELGALYPCDTATRWLEGHADVTLRELWSHDFGSDPDAWLSPDGHKLSSWFKWLVISADVGLLSRAVDDGYYRVQNPREELIFMRAALPLRVFLDALQERTR